jgi:hypothetical protein
MDVLSLLVIWKFGKSRLAFFAAEGDGGSVATQFIAFVEGEEITARYFLLAHAACEMTTFIECFVAECAACIQRNTFERGHTSKCSHRKKLLTPPTTAIRLLTIPAFPLVLPILIALAKRNPLLPLAPFSLLSPLLLLPLYRSLCSYSLPPLFQLHLLAFLTDISAPGRFPRRM